MTLIVAGSAHAAASRSGPPPQSLAETERTQADREHAVDPLEALVAGRPVVVADDDRVHLVVAAAVATMEAVSAQVRHGSGFLVAAAPTEVLDAVGLPAAVPRGAAAATASLTVPFDAVGVGTGISARDRATTLRVLADPATVPADLSRPGHLVAARIHPSGVLGRPGVQEAASDLARLAGLPPVAGICALVAEDGDLLAPDQAARFAATHGYPLVRIDDVVRRRIRSLPPLEAWPSLPSPAHDGATVHRWRDQRDGAVHIALTAAARGREADLVAVLVDCRLGRLTGPQTCRCEADHAAARALVQARGGVLLHLSASTQHDLAGTAAAVLARLGTTRVHLARPLSMCAAGAAEFGGLARQLRRLGVVVDREFLLDEPG